MSNDLQLDVTTEIRDLAISNLDSYSGDDKLKILASLLGYKQMPVTIDEFLDDPYYMGDVSQNFYPYWREVLREILPTPIHTSTPIIVFTGAIGTGKSTAVRFLAEYMKHRIACLKDPYKTFGFVPGKNLKFSFFHRTGTLAQTDFLDVMDDWEDRSPYFKELHEMGRLDIIEQVSDSIWSNSNIGSDVLFYNLSELNFLKKESAEDKLDQALKRWSSRFDRVSKYFGAVIIDTSSQGDESIADDFINDNPYGDMVRAIHTNKWKVRVHLNYYGQKGWFKVYAGDGIHDPFIIDKDKGRVITSEMDPDRVIDVPEEERANFEYNIETALQDIAGISTTSSDRFYRDTSNLLKCFTLPQYGPDVVKFDFFDKTDKLIYKFDRSIRDIPDDRIIYIRYDVGVTGDNTGLAVGYFDGWEIYDRDKNIKSPIIKIPLAVGINRFEGQETPLEHLYEFIMDLNERFEIGGFSADQYQSRMILQNLTRESIPNKYISVDRTDEAYVYLKSLTQKRLIHLPQNKLLREEIASLRRVGRKIDHPSTGCFVWNTNIKVKNKKSGEVGVRSIGDLHETGIEECQVLSYDQATKKFDWVDIKASALTKYTVDLCRVEFEDGSEYKCTSDHKFLTLNRDWVRAVNLDRDDQVISIDGVRRIRNSERYHTLLEVPVYDIEVCGDNPNFLLSNGVVVHNSKDIADAVAGLVNHIYQDIDKAGQISVKYKSRSYAEALEDRIQTPTDKFQDALTGLF